MRLKISKSKNANLYYIIKDYTNIDEKRSTVIYDKLGNQKQVEERFAKLILLVMLKNIFLN